MFTLKNSLKIFGLFLAIQAGVSTYRRAEASESVTATVDKQKIQEALADSGKRLNITPFKSVADVDKFNQELLTDFNPKNKLTHDRALFLLWRGGQHLFLQAKARAQSKNQDVVFDAIIDKLGGIELMKGQTCAAMATEASRADDRINQADNVDSQAQKVVLTSQEKTDREELYKAVCGRSK